MPPDERTTLKFHRSFGGKGGKFRFFISPQDYQVIFDRQPLPSFEHDRDLSPYLIMIDFLRAYNTREEYFVVEEIFEAILRPIISCIIKIVFSFNFFLLIFSNRITAFLNYLA